MEEKMKKALTDLEHLHEDYVALHRDLLQQHDDLKELHADYRLFHDDLQKQHQDFDALKGSIKSLVRNMKVLEAITAVGLVLLIVKFFV